MSSRSRVFISHNKADKAKARALANAFQAVGCRAWFDEWENKPGESIVGGIELGLGEADVFVLCWSASAAQSNWVGTEVRATLRRRVDDATLRIVPLLLDDTPLPALVAEYSGFHYVSETEAPRMASLIAGFRAQPAKVALSDLLDQLERSYESDEPLVQSGGIPTGYIDLDRVLGGLKSGRLYVVAGIEGVGARQFVLDVACHIAVEQHRVALFVSYGASSTELMTQATCSLGRIPLERVRSGEMNEADWTKMSHAIGQMAEAPLYLLDDPPLDRQALRHVIRDHVSAAHCEVAILEALPTVNDLSTMTEIRSLAREIDIPLVVTARTPRSAERLPPAIGDLQDAVASVADVLVFLHRTELYEAETELRGLADVAVARHRDGAEGRCTLAYLEQYGRFANLARGI
jgi:hypothetical protein